MRIKKSDLRDYIELAIVFFVLSTGGAYKYAFFAAWAAFHVFTGRTKWRLSTLYILLPSLSWVVIGLIMNVYGGLTAHALKEAVFAIFPPLGALVLWNKLGNERFTYLNSKFFYVIIFVFAATQLPHFSASDLLESQYAYIFGAYVIYFIFKKDCAHTIIAAIALILAHKRSVLGSVVLGMAFLFFFAPKKGSRKKAIRILTFIGISSVTALLAWIFLCKTDLISALLRTFGIRDMGRLKAWRNFIPLYSFSITQPGFGLGSVKILLDQWNIPGFDRLHNDILVLYYQLGAIGFIVHIYSHFYFIKKYYIINMIDYRTAIVLCALVIYSLANYLVGNNSIYINYTFPLYILMIQCIAESKISKDALANGDYALKKQEGFK